MTSQVPAFVPIGVVYSPFKDVEGAPIQPSGARGVLGRAVIEPEYAEGLKDLEGFSHIYLLYAFHLCEARRLSVTPFLDGETRGVFATRAPCRPNPIGLSVVRLLGVEGNVLRLEDVDVVDGTPLLDIKPYVPEFDAQSEVRTGWLTGRADKGRTLRADDRFNRQPA
ncbi:MAG: tRNA (N6-threonylcarbamoyladenosine(37)-N6)-methyltransferase TrmO [Desulfovibrionaceae bacterium]|nr:tRNA (N6-threonylcarbamoyladenosine(37)-N6)-methyltransferase TrmO [Desulfovibrionaceae bacterium]MDD4951354.1 tRNA (N6-threonylcarbamoyladenosine(37)-N6)-methyltransferase TrmO [Desulfovibrionaceae bacterium]